MPNIKSIINIHDIEVITEKKTQEINCNCINKPVCPLPNQCQITNTLYYAKKYQIFEIIMKIYTTESAKAHLKVH